MPIVFLYTTWYPFFMLCTHLNKLSPGCMKGSGMQQGLAWSTCCTCSHPSEFAVKTFKNHRKARLSSVARAKL